MPDVSLRPAPESRRWQTTRTPRRVFNSKSACADGMTWHSDRTPEEKFWLGYAPKELRPLCAQGCFIQSTVLNSLCSVLFFHHGLLDIYFQHGCFLNVHVARSSAYSFPPLSAAFHCSYVMFRPVSCVCSLPAFISRRCIYRVGGVVRKCFIVSRLCSSVCESCIN